MSIVKSSFVLAGLQVNVYAVEGASTGPAVVLFLLHGRGGSAEDAEPVARNVLQDIIGLSKEGQTQGHDLLIVTFDLRNHGSRLVDTKSNEAWTGGEKHNDRHAVDMYSIQTGTARDVSFLIDFLPSYLFPSDERAISQWLAAGVSLGGHSTWILLRNEPRIRLGIPIIGCADYLSLLTQRAERSGVVVQPPIFPESLLAYIKQNDPIFAPYTAADSSNPFLGKKILALSGGRDTLVPWSITENFFSQLHVGEGGVKKAVVEPETGHRCTQGMVQEMSAFIWEHALRGSSESNNQ